MVIPKRARRHVLLSAVSVLAFVAAGCGGASTSASGSSGSASSSPSSSILATLKSAGTIKVGIANQAPYSFLTPNGDVAGFGPTVVETVMKKLGVSSVKGFVAPYSNLIPGLNAHRWDMVSATMDITAARCKQVLFTGPVSADGGAIGYVPSVVKTPPTSVKAAAQAGLTVGVLQGSYLVPLATQEGVASSKVVQFPDNVSLIDGLTAGRVQVILTADSGLKYTLAKLKKSNQVSVVFPLSDAPLHKAGFAFRKSDAAFRTAFEAQLVALKKSGQYTKLLAQYNLPIPPQSVLMETPQQACGGPN